MSDPTSSARQPVDVLILARELNLGGVERDVAKIAMRLDRSRFRPHVGTFYASGLRYEELRLAGVPILHFPLRSLLSKEAWRCAGVMRRYIRQHNIQVVHSYDATGVFSTPVARLAGVPAILTSQLSYRALLDPRTRNSLRVTDWITDVVLVNCEAIRRHMIDDEHVPAKRVELCYNGVVTEEFFPPLGGVRTRPPELADATLVIGTLCVLRPEKALRVLQEGFAKLRQLLSPTVQAGLRLLIVGSGPELEGLRAHATRLGIADQTVFVPATRDVAHWMRAIDIYVLPSYSEAFSNSLLEAMACGCAPVGSRIGGTPELIGSQEERGLLFTSGDTEGLASQLERLIANPELRHGFGARGVSFVRENLTIDIAVAKTGAIYDKLLSRKRG